MVVRDVNGGRRAYAIEGGKQPVPVPAGSYRLEAFSEYSEGNYGKTGFRLLSYTAHRDTLLGLGTIIALHKRLCSKFIPARP